VVKFCYVATHKLGNTATCLYSYLSIHTHDLVILVLVYTYSHLAIPHLAILTTWQYMFGVHLCIVYKSPSEILSDFPMRKTCTVELLQGPKVLE